jgi:hypothetical protein
LISSSGQPPSCPSSCRTTPITGLLYKKYNFEIYVNYIVAFRAKIEENLNFKAKKK